MNQSQIKTQLKIFQLFQHYKSKTQEEKIKSEQIRKKHQTRSTDKSKTIYYLSGTGCVWSNEASVSVFLGSDAFACNIITMSMYSPDNEYALI